MCYFFPVRSRKSREPFYDRAEIIEPRCNTTASAAVVVVVHIGTFSRLKTTPRLDLWEEGWVVFIGVNICLYTVAEHLVAHRRRRPYFMSHYTAAATSSSYTRR